MYVDILHAGWCLYTYCVLKHHHVRLQSCQMYLYGAHFVICIWNKQQENNRETDSMRSVLLLVWIIVSMSELGIVRCDKTATELSKKITDVHFQLFKFIENQNKMLKVRMYNFDVCCLANRYSRFSITILLSLTLDGCVWDWVY